MASFAKDGFSIVKQIYKPQELETIRTGLNTRALHTHSIWAKEHAASSYNIYHLATQPAIIEKLKPLLGSDIILWGAIYLDRSPGQVHPWHTDIESSRPEGGFVTVWIGIEGTNQASSLKLVPGSHEFDQTVQETMHINGSKRKATTDDHIETWASELAGDPVQITQPNIIDGDAIFFDGRTWHGSANTNVESTRRALIFQYSVPDAPIKVPDFRHLSWPFVFLDAQKPPCLIVSGSAKPEINPIADPPPRITADLTNLETGIHTMDLDAQIPGKEIKFSSILLHGKTANLQHLTSHYSVLKPGESPHPPHSHVDEELLIILQGEAELHYSDHAGNITPHRVSTGDFVYYPAFHQHTIYNASEQPVVYLMFKWVNTPEFQSKITLELQRGKIESLQTSAGDEGAFNTQELFSSPTHHLNQLRCHISTIQPNGGYDEHSDSHDIAIIVFEGEIHLLGKTVKAGEMAWCSAGEPHGTANLSEKPARYLVFEFHGDNCATDMALFDVHQEKKKPIKLVKKRSPGRVIKNIKRAIGIR